MKTHRTTAHLSHPRKTASATRRAALYGRNRQHRGGYRSIATFDETTRLINGN